MHNEIDQLYNDHANDPRPLPLIIAELWAFPLVYVETDNGNVYQVQHWIAGVAQTDNPGRFWSDLKQRAKKSGVELYASCVQLPYHATNGKTYKFDFANAETLYYITQRMSAETGIRGAVLRYLARAGVQLDDMRLDPAKAIGAGVEAYRKRGKDDTWIDSRAQGIIARDHFTSAIAAALNNPLPLHYALATNEVYMGLWKRTAQQLKAELGLGKNANLRDHQPSIALDYQRIAESAIGLKLGDADSLTWEQAESIIRMIAGLVGGQAAQLGAMLGRDLATGKKLLGE